MRDYVDLPVAGEAAIRYYSYRRLESSYADSINEQNKIAQEHYRFLTNAIKKWGDWCHAEQLKDYLKELCSVSIENINDIKQVWYESQPKQICLKCRNAQELSLIVYDTALTPWDTIDMDDEGEVKKITETIYSYLGLSEGTHVIETSISSLAPAPIS